MARLAPKDRETEFFGLFTLLNRATAFLGPALAGAVRALSGSQCACLASIIVLFFAGAVLLLRVPEP